MLEIGEQPARSRELGAAEAAEAVERRDPEMRLQPPLALDAAEIMAGAQDRALAEGIGAIGLDKLAGGQPRDLGRKLGSARLHQLEPPGRDIAHREAKAALGTGERDQPVLAARIEQCLFGQRARRDEADDRALDQRLRSGARLGLGGRFGLLGNRDAVPRLDQPCEIALGAVHGHAAHRHRIAAMRPARGQRDIEHRRCRLGIVEE